MGSMRLLWAAGDPCRKNNATAYNCWFCSIDDLKRFSEILFLLTSGGGVGYSVERKVINKLPKIEKQTGKKLEIFIIPDSREGWADALDIGIKAWYNGQDIGFNYSKIRPEGSRLKTFGGRSAGPQPLKNLLEFTKNIILKAQGRKLRSIEVHDIVTKIGEIVVAGGTRRSAQISLSDLNDKEMRLAKVGKFWLKNGHRAMANNSAIYESKPTQKEFLKEWYSLMESESGERGIYNRFGVMHQIPTRRKALNYQGVWGGNPCLEILLRSCQACNLTEVIARENDTEESLLRKIRIATILGTYQSMLTNFTYLSNDWKKNCEEERLLGVSITGQFDSMCARNPIILRKLRERAIEVNKEYAQRFGINQSSAITCTKPSGTVSQLVNASSGAHPRFAKYYIRRVRISSYDPLFKLLKDVGIKYYPEVGQKEDTANTFVLEFYIKSPSNCITRKDISAMQQLNHWKKVKLNFTEHTVSSTIYVGDNEWLEVGRWLHKNWDIIGGLSFLPRDNGIYELTPYQEISKKEYDRAIKKFPKIDFSKILDYEKKDETQGSKEVACGNGICEII